MSSDILITDDRLNFSLSLVDFLRVQGQRVIVTSDSERIKEKKPENAIGPVILWNRQSAFSLQSLPLQFKNLQLNVETALLIFDGQAYAELYSNSGVLHTDKIVTELITANMQLAYTLMRYFIHKKSGKLIFVHRDVSGSCGNIPVAAASGAFVRMAEASTASLAQEENALLQTMLVRLEGEDNALYIEWLAAQINQPALSRMPGKWIKAGQRGLFGK
ncbi:hypothetical protein E4N70_10245 [Treponema vincentii]|jgi:hypothetical protein|uniref:Uncharacterized protein n=2 Tax=Treponema vincentii TaxID=69710 RepID=S3ME30_9SPIR|nr:hypothetical protein [Treponema vincentii]EEV20499.1 hypothetical protein TREVI0001_0321 [Treponema vincentii ATCC 35580]EPF47324.1 hypothetical protein HMPREF1222_01148 [Treponema vincentii F0403]UTC59790.1 hypothetical protein E4N70_10245 [Treponema vincentii]